MGPVGENNLRVAPHFYSCQVDRCGPFNAYSPVNKRATLKIWFTVILLYCNWRICFGVYLVRLSLWLREDGFT